MLKPAEPLPGEPDPSEGRPIGELLNQLVDDGKAYAQAEINVAKAVAQAKVDAVKLPAVLGLAAFLFVQAGVVILGLSIHASLSSRLGPFLAGLVATLLFLAIAAGLGWYAARRLKDLL